MQYEEFNTFFQNNSKTELPIRLITVAGGKCFGTVTAIENDLKYKEVYLATENAGQYYTNLGWEYVETCIDEFGQTVEVYKYELQKGGGLL